jgi:hypothetical protein
MGQSCFRCNNSPGSEPPLTKFGWLEGVLVLVCAMGRSTGARASPNGTLDKDSKPTGRQFVIRFTRWGASSG